MHLKSRWKFLPRPLLYDKCETDNPTKIITLPTPLSKFNCMQSNIVQTLSISKKNATIFMSSIEFQNRYYRFSKIHDWSIKWRMYLFIGNNTNFVNCSFDTFSGSNDGDFIRRIIDRRYANLSSGGFFQFLQSLPFLSQNPTMMIFRDTNGDVSLTKK